MFFKMTKFEIRISKPETNSNDQKQKHETIKLTAILFSSQSLQKSS